MPLPSAFYAWGRGMLALDAGFAFLTLPLELFQDRCPHGPSLLLNKGKVAKFCYSYNHLFCFTGP